MTPVCDRICKYCDHQVIDDEMHFILLCDTFRLKRQCFLKRLNALNPEFDNLTCEQKLSYILCPPSIDVAKCVSKFLGIMTNIRKEIDMGFNPQGLDLYLKHVADSS